MKKIFLIPFLLVTVYSAIAQQSSLLWEISGNGLKKPSYVYGTMHVRDSRVFQFGDSVLPALQSCKALAGELVMDNANPMALLGVIMMPKDTTLSMLLSEEDYSLVKEQAEEKLGFMAAMIDNVKPFFTSALLAESEFGSDSVEFLDQYFQDLASELGKEILGIETMEEQMAAVDQISLKEQAEMLLSSLKEDGQNEKVTAEMLDIYLKQDLDGFETFMAEQKMSDVMTKSVLVDRNKIMSERIDTMIQRRPTFVAIGAAHLGGKEGVLEGLKQRGYHVRAVYSPFNTFSEKEVTKDADGWFVFEANEYEVAFPSQYKKTENDKTVFMMTVDMKSGSLFTSSEGATKEKANQFFKKKLKEYKQSGEKILESKKYSVNGVPALEVSIEKGLYFITFVYYHIGEKFVELSVTGDMKELHSKSTEKFFQSFKKN